MLSKYGCGPRPLDWHEFITWVANSWMSKSLDASIKKLCLQPVVYAIWKEWNNHKFRNEHLHCVAIFKAIVNSIRLRLCSLQIPISTANVPIFQEWRIPM